MCPVPGLDGPGNISLQLCDVPGPQPGLKVARIAVEHGVQHAERPAVILPRHEAIHEVEAQAGLARIELHGPFEQPGAFFEALAAGERESEEAGGLRVIGRDLEGLAKTGFGLGEAAGVVRDHAILQGDVETGGVHGCASIGNSPRDRPLLRRNCNAIAHVAGQLHCTLHRK